MVAREGPGFEILGAGFRSDLSSLEAASLTGVTLAAGLTGFTLERRLWWASIAFSLSVALIGALVVGWNGSPEDWSVGEGWRMVSLLLAAGADVNAVNRYAQAPLHVAVQLGHAGRAEQQHDTGAPYLRPDVTEVRAAEKPCEEGNRQKRHQRGTDPHRAYTIYQGRIARGPVVLRTVATRMPSL